MRRYNVSLDDETLGLLARIGQHHGISDRSSTIRFMAKKEARKMNRTDWQRLTRKGLELIVDDYISDNRSVDLTSEVGTRLDIVSRELHDRDGWVDWSEIWQAVNEEAEAIIARRRKSPESVWYSIRNAVEAWYISKRPAS